VVVQLGYFLSTLELYQIFIITTSAFGANALIVRQQLLLHSHLCASRLQHLSIEFVYFDIGGRGGRGRGGGRRLLCFSKKLCP